MYTHNYYKTFTIYKKNYNYIKKFLHYTIMKKKICVLNIRMANLTLNLS